MSELAALISRLADVIAFQGTKARALEARVQELEARVRALQQDSK